MIVLLSAESSHVSINPVDASAKQEETALRHAWRWSQRTRKRQNEIDAMWTRRRSGDPFFSLGGLVLALLALALARVQSGLAPAATPTACAGPLPFTITLPETLQPPAAATPAASSTPAPVALRVLLRADDTPAAHALQIVSGGIVPLLLPRPCSLAPEQRAGPEPCVTLAPPAAGCVPRASLAPARSLPLRVHPRSRWKRRTSSSPVRMERSGSMRCRATFATTIQRMVCC